MSNRVLLIALFANVFTHVLCQGYQEFLRNEAGVAVPVIDGGSRKSMIGMLSKFIEINGTIDQLNEGSTTEHSFGRMWLNATERPIPNGICEHEEQFTEEIIVTERIPFQVEVEVWCFPEIRCTEWETQFREEKQRRNLTQTRLVNKHAREMKRKNLLIRNGKIIDNTKYLLPFTMILMFCK